MKQSFLKVPSMHSLSSANTLSNAIENIDGVKNVDIDYQKSIVGIFYENNDSVMKDIYNKIESCGYKVDRENTL